MKLKYLGPSAGALLAFGLFGMLPVRAASALGGWIGRHLGPCLPRHRTARNNIERALPALTAAEVDRIMNGMWDNLGRVAAEFSHLGAFSRAERANNGLVAFAGLEHLERLKSGYRGAIFVGGHVGNWEVTPLILRRADFETVVVYRPPNVPVVERLVRRQRAAIHPEMAIKRQDVKALVSALRAHRSATMLVDQKLWQGRLLPFFGGEAHTTTLPAKLALRYRVPIVPLRAERLSGSRFLVSAHPPIDPAAFADGSGGEDAEVALTLAVNRVLEGWIRERPDQWVWLHRRWKIRTPRRAKKQAAGEAASAPAPGANPKPSDCPRPLL